MFAKILAVATLVAYAQAIELGHVSHATSYSSINTHLSAAPETHYAPIAHVAQVAHVAHVAPVAHYSHVAPVAHVAHVSHVAPVAHVAHVAHVAPVAHVAHVAPVYKAVHQEEVYADAHPHYSFQYGVHDGHTGDVKDQHEERDGDVVKGSYSLVQPDGITRTVHYSADHHNGFNAQVEYSGHAAHPQKAVLAKAIIPAKTIIAAPAYYHH